MNTPPHRRPVIALIFICLSVFVISIDTTIVNVALPTLSVDLHADTAQMQWMVDAYTLVVASLLLSAGSLSDRYGRRAWLSMGLVLFAITSAVAALTTSAEGLIAARAAMGIGAAIIFPTTLALITNIFSDPGKRATAIAAWAAMTGVGVALGPITGGWLLQHFWWGSVFLVNVPIVMVAVLGVALFVPTSRDPAASPVDVPGFVLSAMGLAALVYTIIEGPTVGWRSAQTLAGFGIAASVLAAFGWWEIRREHPMLDLSVFRNRRFSGGSLAITASFLALFGFVFLVTQYFQFVKHFSAFETGVRLLPVAVSIAVASALGPRLVARIGTTAVVAGGLATFAAGLAWASAASAVTPYGEIAMQMILVGGGLGLTIAPATESIMGAVSVDKAGVGSAVNDTTRALGGTLGVAIVGSVFASVFSSRVADVPALAGLPDDVREAAQASMAVAQQVVVHVPQDQAAGVGAAVEQAFMEGVWVGSLVCAGIAFGAACVVAVLLPARASGPSAPKRALQAVG